MNHRSRQFVSSSSSSSSTSSAVPTLSLHDDHFSSSAAASSSSPNSRAASSANSSPDSKQQQLSHFNLQSQSQSHSPHSHWNKTSFKIGKSKASKTKYLTKKELVGVGLSALVSLCISLSVMAGIYYLSPVVIAKLLDVIEYGRANIFPTDTAESSSHTIINENNHNPHHHHHHHQSNNPTQLLKASNPGIPMKVIKVYDRLTVDNFKSVYFNKAPVLFVLNQAVPEINEQLKLVNITQPDIDVCPDAVLQKIAMLGDETINLLPMSYFTKIPREEPPINTVARSYSIFTDPQVSLDIGSDKDSHYFAVSTSLASKAGVNIDNVLSKNSNLKNIFNGEPSIVLGRNENAVAGSPFHAHKQILHYLVRGKKHWALFKYDALPASGFNPNKNLRDWLKLNLGDNNVLHVFQEAGQTIYIPEGWYHASDTLSDTSIGITFPANSTQSNSFFHYLQEGMKRIKFNDVQGGIRLFKLGLGISRSHQLLELYADALVASESYTAAEEVMREVIQENPRNTAVYSKLINLMINHANKDISESIAELLNQAETFGIRDEVLLLSQQQL